MRTEHVIKLAPADIQRFVNTASKCDFDIDIASDGYTNQYVDAGGTQNQLPFGRQNDAALEGKMIVSPEVIVEAAGPLGDAPSRPIKAFYNLCGYDPSEESPILLSWIGDFFLSGGLPKMATCSESKQFTVCNF